MADPIQKANSNLPIQPASPQSGGLQQSGQVNGPSFSDTYNDIQKLRFSNHAQKRLESRNITIGDEGLNRLSDAVQKAEQRGGRESLVLMDDLAFIVNVRERLVVTALDMQNNGDGVFTKIDSVVVTNPPAGNGEKKA